MMLSFEKVNLEKAGSVLGLTEPFEKCPLKHSLCFRRYYSGRKRPFSTLRDTPQKNSVSLKLQRSMNAQLPPYEVEDRVLLLVFSGARRHYTIVFHLAKGTEIH